MSTSKYISRAVALAAVASLAVAVPALAEPTNTTPIAHVGVRLNGGMMGARENGEATTTPRGRMRGLSGIHKNKFSTTTPGTMPGITGNGQPIVAGSVTAISGTTLTITNKSNVTYTINAASTTVTKAGAAAALSSVAVGDNVVVQGAVTGTNVTASTIIDQAAPNTNSTGGDTGTTEQTPHGNFFGGIGAFFSHLFGF